MPLTPAEHHQQHNHLTLSRKCWVSGGTDEGQALCYWQRQREQSLRDTGDTEDTSWHSVRWQRSHFRVQTCGNAPLDSVVTASKLVLTWEDLEYGVLQECTGWADIAYTRGAPGISEGSLWVCWPTYQTMVLADVTHPPTVELSANRSHFMQPLWIKPSTEVFFSWGGTCTCWSVNISYPALGHSS